MIHGVYANQPSFHPVQLTTGLNVILAERTDTSTQKDTRNGLGKSTLIDIIDFCLGSRVKKNEGLIIEPLSRWAFTIDITIAGSRVKVTRSVADHNRIVIEGETAGWIEQPDRDARTGELIFKVERWRAFLGWALFGLSISRDDLKYVPKFRSLVSYFIRTGPGAYIDPFKHYQQQCPWDMQIHTAYLLGMNWEYASRWQSLKDEEEGIKALEKAVKSGVLGGTGGTIGELEAQRIQLEQEVEIGKAGLETFRVHPQYEAIQSEADRTTVEIHDLLNLNVVDRQRLRRYEEAIAEEAVPGAVTLERLYSEAGLLFPEGVRRTINEARRFHEDIISFRRDFLRTEMERLGQSIGERESRIAQLTETRSRALEILQTHGALEEMNRLRERYMATVGRLEVLRERILDMKELRVRKREVEAAKADLLRVAEQDHDERREMWSAAVRLFNENSQALYERPGTLVIDIGKSFYKYQVDIERSGSEGIEKMKIFCLDIALLQLQLGNNGHIGFLIHDTLMYDAVDARQRARAIERAAHVSHAGGGQYICTMNSDMVPRSDFSGGFDFDSHVRLVLTDSSPDGSLLGIRFERPGR